MVTFALYFTIFSGNQGRSLPITNCIAKKNIATPKGIEFFSRVSYLMTQVTDRFSGIGVAMRAEIQGIKDGAETSYRTTMVHENTAIAAGAGTGSIAQLILEGKLKKPGIHPVEQALSTELFQEVMQSRQIKFISN